MKFDIVKRGYVWLLIALILVVGSITVFFKNMRLSKEFTGGIELKIQIQADTSKLKNDLTTDLNQQGYQTDVFVDSQGGYVTLLIKTPSDDDVKITNLSHIVEQFLVSYGYIESPAQIAESSVIGATIGAYMRSSAFYAIGAGLLVLALYMIFSFASIRKVISPLTLALITILTMFFDITIPSGAYGIWMSLNQTIQIDSIFIISILTTMAYSINDTIIIFDRIRENLNNQRIDGREGKAHYLKVFEESLWQTMRRSFGTSSSVLLVIISMFFFGAGVIKLFAFTIGMGVIAGTFSSIFIAAPLAYLLTTQEHKKK